MQRSAELLRVSKRIKTGKQTKYNMSAYVRKLRTYVCICVGIYVRIYMAQLVKALRYKTAGHGFDSRWCQWIFSLA
jgi:hypothetical protein